MGATGETSQNASAAKTTALAAERRTDRHRNGMIVTRRISVAISLLASSEMVSHGSLEPRFQVRILARQPRSVAA